MHGDALGLWRPPLAKGFAGSRLLLRPLREALCVETLRPPVEAGGGADERGLRLEGDAALGLRLLEFLY